MILRLLLVGLALAGTLRSESTAARAAEAPATAPVRVVALHPLLAEFARRIGADELAVHSLVPAGGDPHRFEPAPVDLRRLEAADLILAGGLGLEPYLARLGTLLPAGRVVEVGPRLPGLLAGTCAHGHAHEELGPDPHWWHGCAQVAAAVEVIRAELAARRPEAAPRFAAGAAALQAEIANLATEVAGAATRLPAAGRHLVTSHDAFGYLARDLRLSVHPVLGPSTDAEADARRLAELVRFVRRERVPAVFVEHGVNPRLVETLVDEAGVRLGGALYADGPGATGATTWAAMMRHNLATLVAAFTRPTP